MDKYIIELLILTFVIFVSLGRKKTPEFLRRIEEDDGVDGDGGSDGGSGGDGGD